MNGRGKALLPMNNNYVQKMGEKSNKVTQQEKVLSMSV